MFPLKIILLGNSGVGKTSLLRQYVTGALGPDTMYTIGVEFKIKEIQVDGKDVRLALWDTAGLSMFFRYCQAQVQDPIPLPTIPPQVPKKGLGLRLHYRHIFKWATNHKAIF